MKKILYSLLLPIFLIFINSFSGKTQELNCQVSVIVDAKLPLTTMDREVLDQLKEAMYNMMNTTKWTNDNFALEERVNCNLQLQIMSQPKPGTFEGFLQIQASRPVYNSDYNTNLINFQDDYIIFNYSRNALLVYSPNQYRDELTSIMAFYAYYILGMDYDSFSSKGGSKYFNEAQNIVSLAQSQGGPGWLASDKKKKNRFYLVDNILQQLFEPLRVCNYEYHRFGMDKLYDDPIKARLNIIKSLTLLNQIAESRPNSVNLINFVQAKSTELKNLFTDAEQKEKSEVVNILKKIDAANTNKYNEILN
ncbi:MAG: DUF4835 family protein [Flavobacteriia bacterium]|nr:DUF4835 family protein [Flavobacteriia bacterium]